MYQLCMPQLQIVSGEGAGAHTSIANSTGVSLRSLVASVIGVASVTSMSVKEGKEGPVVDEEKCALRREIEVWWEGVVDHLDGLVGHFSFLPISQKKANTQTGNHHCREHTYRVLQGTAASALRG
jgi:hypothetical protein